jgi:hypothetical protein
MSTMDKPQPSAVFGMNFLQDMKDFPDDVPGTYDPEQEVWSMPALPGVKDDLVNYLVIYLEQNGLVPGP